jgi:hypothetical protein
METSKVLKSRQIEELKTIIKKFSYLYEEIGIETIILQAYLLEKPLTEIEIYKKPYEIVMLYILELKKYFFVDKLNSKKSKKCFTGVIHISRFRNVIEIVRMFDYLQPFENFHDIRGIFFGYSLTEVAEFCQKDDLVKL